METALELALVITTSEQNVEKWLCLNLYDIYIYIYIYVAFHSHGGIPKWMV